MANDFPLADCSPEDLNFIDAMVGGKNRYTAYKSCYAQAEAMDEVQQRLAACEAYDKFEKLIQTRKKKLKEEGFLDDMLEFDCTYKQLLFVREYLLYSGSDKVLHAYDNSYGNLEMSSHARRNTAYRVLSSEGVKRALLVFRKRLEEETEYSLGEYIKELDENRAEAKKLGQVSAMNSVTVEKGKLFGYAAKLKEPGSKENPFHLAVNQSFDDLINSLNTQKDKQ